MQLHSFIAESASDAVAQIRAQLGPQAVVVNVRPIPGEGLSRIWQKRRMEVLAYVPESANAGSDTPVDAVAQLRQELAEIRQRFDGRGVASGMSVDSPIGAGVASNREPIPFEGPAGVRATAGPWRIGTVLENSGLLPMHAHRVLEELRVLHGDTPPVALGMELELAGNLLREHWRKKRVTPQLDRGVHVFIGPPGTGKTVCLCKCLAQSVLVEERPATVWRLDGRTANTAESLNVYAEILGVPVERCIPAQGESLPAELLLIDLPGVNSQDAEALAQLGEQLKRLPEPQVHLVLNAAYESNLLLAQVRAYSALPVDDIIVTHLDEELRWGKLWNLVLGTNCSLSFLSAGQNIPGVWSKATPDRILARQFPGK
jgi:flagellar biosynthesis protein FlhF